MRKEYKEYIVGGNARVKLKEEKTEIYGELSAISLFPPGLVVIDGRRYEVDKLMNAEVDMTGSQLVLRCFKE
jgi:hypothetical protein